MMTNQQLAQTIGWTLIHSLWQSLVIFLVLLIVLRAVPTRSAAARYALSVGALSVTIVGALVTFFLLLPSASLITEPVFNAAYVTYLRIQLTTSEWAGALAWVDQNLYWFTRFWLLGISLGFLRVLSGLLYISYLRRHSMTVAGNWEERINLMANQMNIRRKVSIAEATVTSPVVVGYLKPMVLFPVGLLSGLSLAQVETILLHELAHIRRHDFVVNLIQSLIETVFFFNPFTWFISSRIREERENCCDDAVLIGGVDPLSYIKTLAQLEDYRSSNALALGVLGNGNQLLSRMKRIMENTGKKEWGSTRILPLSLIMIGFACASWLSVSSSGQSVRASTSNETPVKLTPGDTSITTKIELNGVYTRITKTDQNGKVIEQTIIDGDESSPAVAWEPLSPIYPQFEFPSMVEPVWEQIPADAFALTPFPHDSFLYSDSVPRGFHPGVGEWDLFEQEFRERFQGEFKEFYEKNKSKFDQMMQEMRAENLDALMTTPDGLYSEDAMRELERQMATLAPQMEGINDLLPKITQEHALMEEQAAKMAQDAMLLRKMDFEKMSELAQLGERAAIAQEGMFREHEDQTRSFERALVDQLVKDGYLAGKDEKKDIRFENGEITSVNGKKIKEEHKDVYRRLSDEYARFKRSHRRTE